MFVVEKTVWDDGDTDYDVSIQDSRLDQNWNTAWGRIKRATKALFGKPVCFTDMYISGSEEYLNLVNDMRKLAE
jgi:hypothetical protein